MRKKGQALIQTLGIMFATLMVGAFAIDAGLYFAVHQGMQNSADAAALAAINDFFRSTSNNLQDRQNAAIAAAQDLSDDNMGNLLNVDDIEFGYVNPATSSYDPNNFTNPNLNDPALSFTGGYNAVRVTVNASNGEANGPVQSIFAKYLGLDSFNSQAQAIAIFGGSVSGASGLRPVYLCQTAWDQAVSLYGDPTIPEITFYGDSPISTHIPQFNYWANVGGTRGRNDMTLLLASRAKNGNGNGNGGGNNSSSTTTTTTGSSSTGGSTTGGSTTGGSTTGGSTTGSTTTGSSTTGSSTTGSSSTCGSTTGGSTTGSSSTGGGGNGNGNGNGNGGGNGGGGNGGGNGDTFIQVGSHVINTSGTCGNLGAGNWGFSDLANSGGAPGAATVREWFANGYPGTVNVGGTYQSMPGNQIHAYDSELQSLITNQTVFTIPLYSSTSGNGSNATYVVSGIAAFRLTAKQTTGGTRYLRGHFERMVCTSNCSISSNTIGGSITRLRLIH